MDESTKRKKSLNRRIIINVAILMAVVAVFVAVLSYLALENTYMRLYNEKAQDIVRNLASRIDPEKIDTMKTVMETMAAGKTDESKKLMMGITDEQGTLQEEIPADAQAVFERSGWEHVSEWIGEIPDLGADKQSFFQFRVRSDSPVADSGFPMLMLAVMATRCDALKGGMYCNVGRSDDGLNHFTLYRK